MPKLIPPLTDTKIKQTAAQKKPVRLFDGKVTGLHILIQPSGAKLWRLRYKFKNNEKRIALGEYPLVTLERARKIATEHLSKLLDGIDPAAPESATEITTFQEVCEKFIKYKEMNGRSPGTLRKYRECLKNDLEEFAKNDIATVSTREIIKTLEKINTRSNSLAKKNQELISMTIRYAIQREMRPANTQPDLRDIIQKKPSAPKFIPDDLPSTFKKIEKYDEQIMQAAMRLQFLFFVRAAELMGARWSEFDLKKCEWHIPAERMKMRRPHIVPLSTQALSILKALKKITSESPYLFPSQTTDRAMVRDALSKAFRSLKLGIVPHGCRTAASTYLRNAEFTPAAVEAQLSHIESNQIAAAYINKPHAMYLEERKRMMQAWSNYLTCEN